MSQFPQTGLYSLLAVTAFFAIASLVLVSYDTSKFVKTYVTNITTFNENDITIISFNTLIDNILNITLINRYFNITYVKAIIPGFNVIVNASNESYPILSGIQNLTGTIDHILNGTGILVDETIIEDTVISTTAILTVTSITPELSFNVIDSNDITASFNGLDIIYVSRIGGGIGIDVDNADPLNPSILSLAILDIFPGNFISIDKSSSQFPVVSFNTTGLISNGTTTIIPGLGIDVTEISFGNDMINNTGAVALIGIPPITIDTTNPSYTIVDIAHSDLSATLYETSASFGDPLLITNQVYGLGYYKTPPNTNFWQRGNILNITTDSSYVLTFGIAIDENDNIYLSGFSTDTADYPFTQGTVSCGNGCGNSCAITAKSTIDQVWITGFAVYSTNCGNVESHIISSDKSNNIYIGGIFDSTGNIVFNTTTVAAGSCGNNICGWFAKLDASMTLKWYNIVATTSNQASFVDLVETFDDFTYVLGHQDGSAIIGTCTIALGNNMFLAKIDSNTGDCIWIIPALRGDVFNLGSFCQMAIPSSNEIIISGIFDSTITFGDFSSSCSSTKCMFIAKANSTGSWTQLIVDNAGNFFTGVSTTLFANVCGMAIDSDSNIYVTGGLSGSTTFGSLPAIVPASTDFFVAKLAPNGTWIAVNTVHQSGTSLSCGTKMSVDVRNNIYIPGLFYGNVTFGSTSPLLYTGSISPNPRLGPFLLNVTTDLNYVFAKTATSYITTVKTLNYGFIQTAVSQHTNNVFALGATQRRPIFDTITIIPQSSANDAQGYWLAGTQLTAPPAQLVMLTQSGSFGQTLTAVPYGTVTGLSGLSSGSFYYYDNATQTLTTSATPFLAGYALTTTSMFFDPEPIYIYKP
jgi:hypothetical protein